MLCLENQTATGHAACSLGKLRGIHGAHCDALRFVALVVIDGVVDLPRTRKRLPGRPDSFFVQPVDVAKTVYWLTQQPRSAWSFEAEARPFGEVW